MGKPGNKAAASGSHGSSASAGKKSGKKRAAPDAEADAPVELQGSRRFQRRELAKKRKRERSTHFDALQEAQKLVWGRDLQRAKAAERAEVMGQLWEKIADKIADVVFKHDASRLVQLMLKFGNAEHRTGVYEQLKDHILELSKDRYARHIVPKLLKYGTNAQRAAIVASMRGRVMDMLGHKIAAEVVETVYAEYANAGQRAALVEEFFGQEYVLLRRMSAAKPHQAAPSLHTVLEEHADRRKVIMDNVGRTLDKLVEKSLVHHTIVHRVLLEYLEACSPFSRAQMITSLRDAAVHICHTKDGSRVVLKCLAYGRPKDRKNIVKTFKGHVMKIAQDEHAHVVLLGVATFVDDTVLVGKVLMPEVSKHATEMLADKYARRVLLHLLAPLDAKYLPPDVRERLVVPMVPDAKEEGKMVPTCRKDPDVRQGELRKHVLAALVAHACEHAATLLKTPGDSDVLYHLAQAVAGTEHQQPLHDAVVAAVCDDVDSDDAVVRHAAGHRVVKRWIVQGAPIAAALAAALEGKLAALAADMHAVFVVVALCERADSAAAACDEVEAGEAEWGSAESKGLALLRTVLAKHAGETPKKSKKGKTPKKSKGKTPKKSKGKTPKKK